jgi:hypothetical protein
VAYDALGNRAEQHTLEPGASVTAGAGGVDDWNAMELVLSHQLLAVNTPTSRELSSITTKRERA